MIKGITTLFQLSVTIYGLTVSTLISADLSISNEMGMLRTTNELFIWKRIKT